MIVKEGDIADGRLIYIRIADPAGSGRNDPEAFIGAGYGIVGPDRQLVPKIGGGQISVPGIGDTRPCSGYQGLFLH